VTITLSRGAHKMAKEKVIVKRLVSMENLGNINVLCTDKTGTLTEGKIILGNSIAPDGRPMRDPSPYQLFAAPQPSLERRSLAIRWM